MFGRSGKDAGSLLGVEIAFGAIRLLQLERCPLGLGVRAWAVEPLPAGALVDGRIVAHEAVAAALERAFSRSGASSRDVALAVPSSAVIQHELEMPAQLDDDEIGELLRGEVEHYVPFSIDETALDYQISPGSPGTVNVAFTACRQALLDGLETVTDLAGLHARIVDVDSQAWQRVLATQPAGLSATVVLERDEWVFQAFREDASLLFCERQAPGEPQLERLVEFVDHCLLREPGSMPDRLWLAGSQAGGAVLCEQLQQRLGIVTRAFDPLASLLALPHDNANLMAAAPMLGVACGLALRGYA